jgi:hypothetical protein
MLKVASKNKSQPNQSLYINSDEYTHIDDQSIILLEKTHITVNDIIKLDINILTWLYESMETSK